MSLCIRKSLPLLPYWDDGQVNSSQFDHRICDGEYSGAKTSAWVTLQWRTGIISASNHSTFDHRGIHARHSLTIFRIDPIVRLYYLWTIVSAKLLEISVFSFHCEKCCLLNEKSKILLLSRFDDIFFCKNWSSRWFRPSESIFYALERQIFTGYCFESSLRKFFCCKLKIWD